MTRPAVVRLLIALAVLLAAPAAGAAQARTRAPDLRAHRAPSLAAPVGEVEAAARVGRAGRIGRSTLAGAALGAVTGVVAFTVMEQTDDHLDHSEDQLVLIIFTLYGTAAGAILGLIAGAV